MGKKKIKLDSQFDGQISTHSASLSLFFSSVVFFFITERPPARRGSALRRAYEFFFSTSTVEKGRETEKGNVENTSIVEQLKNDLHGKE